MRFLIVSICVCLVLAYGVSRLIMAQEEKDPVTGEIPATGGDAQPPLNRLAKEKSPYLRQHATNPVDWFPWGEEALEKARRENKPIFLSIGYSSCHWCHVMEHESFADAEVAAILNEHFVCIKVDREERPDVDEIYMLAAQLMMRGGGGWPLSVWLTPERKPFFAGTYFPKESKYGRPGFMELLTRIAGLWGEPEKREQIEGDSQQIAARLQVIYDSDEPGSISRATLDQAAGMVAASVDPEYGGFGSQPKFPSPSSVEQLLRANLRTGDASYLEAVKSALDHMQSGGIHDHVGGGFHRYSVTRDWRVPHFEKMLYDNAQLLTLYAWGHLVTGDASYAATARDIAKWVGREMTHPEGGFYSAQDADDPGGPEGEGGFYVWDPAGVRALFPDAQQAEAVMTRFGITDEGNWEERPGQTILERRTAPADPAFMSEAIERMYVEREKRPKPMTDTKILAGWNGLMVSGLARGYQALGDESMLAAAVKAGEFIASDLMRDGKLLRRWIDGEAAHDGVLADYAYVIAAFLDLYESTFDPVWLKRAFALNDKAVALFHDPEQGGFFFTARDAESLIARGKPVMDNARPSGNAIMALNLLRIAELTGSDEARKLGIETLDYFGGRVSQSAMGTAALLNAADFLVSKPREIFVAGAIGDPATRALLEAVWRAPDPNRVVALVTPGIEKLLPPAEGKSTVEGKPAAYVCREFACAAPVTDPAALRR